jgi:cytidine deaminase
MQMSTNNQRHNRQIFYDITTMADDSWWSIVAFTATALATRWWISSTRSRIDSWEDTQRHNNDDDIRYLQQCHNLRERLLPLPRQSHFRVVCLLVLSDGTGIWGTNDEASPWMGGALCAERAAFLQLRLLDAPSGWWWRRPKNMTVKTIYIVSDAPTIPVTPGVLCREYMIGCTAVHPATTRIVLQSAHRSSMPMVTNLHQLYPYPCMYTHMSAEESCALGRQLSDSVDVSNIRINNVTTANIQELLEAARAAASWEDRDMVHPMRYGAAALIRKPLNDATSTSSSSSNDSWKIVKASQWKALEYGGTLDAVGQLGSLLHSQMESPLDVVVIVMVDQFGIPHAPFAPGRSFLVEHGYNHVVCLCSALVSSSDAMSLRTLVVTAVPAESLVPTNCEFR